jgi:hypothetical protein
LLGAPSRLTLWSTANRYRGGGQPVFIATSICPHGHDDLINAAAGALGLAAAQRIGDVFLAANVSPEPRTRVGSDRELALMTRDW